MSIQVADALHRENFTLNFDFVACHHLFNRSPDIAKSNVDSGFLDSAFCGSFSSILQRIEHWIEGDSKGAVDNPSIDVCSKI